MKLVRENINFKRGINSKESLEIGKGRYKGLAEFDKLAKQYGFIEEEIPKNLEESDPHLNFIAFYRNKLGKTIEVYIVTHASNDFPNPMVYYNNKERDIFIWTSKFWKAIIGKGKEMPEWRGLNESLEFKRRQDSRKGLNVGKYRIRTFPFDWSEIPEGNYEALDDTKTQYPQHCLIKIRKGPGNDKLIRQITYWTELSRDPITNKKPNEIAKFAEDWYKDNEFHILRPYYENPELFESINFTRGMDSKESIGVGIKETNRDLEILVKNFKEHFDKYTFLEHRIVRREPRNSSYYTSGRRTDKYPIFFYFKIDSMESTEFGLDRKRKRFKAWFKKNTPYILMSEIKGPSFINKKSPNGYGMSYTFYLDDK